MIADIIEDWIAEADIDGFNIAYVSNPGSFEDVVTLLRPVLVERGLIFENYAVEGGTFRENLLRQPGQHTLRSDHYGSRFNYGSKEEVGTKKRRADELGNGMGKGVGVKKSKKDVARNDSKTVGRKSKRKAAQGKK